MFQFVDSFEAAEKYELQMIRCDDGCAQFIGMAKRDDGKYVFVRSDGKIFRQIINESFDQIKIFNGIHGYAFIVVKRHGQWKVYRYYTSFDPVDENVLLQLGRKLKEIRYRYPTMEAAVDACVCDDDGHHFNMDAEWNAAEWLEEFKKASERKTGKDLHALRTEVYLSTRSLLSSYTVNGIRIKLDEPDESILYNSEIKLKPAVEIFKTVYSVENEDCLKTAIRLQNENPIVLNMASRHVPGGGVEGGAGAQEESLCRSSNYTATLYKQWKNYPLDRNFGAVYSPDVTVFRGTESEGYPLLENPFKTNFVAVAALRNPELADGKYTSADRERTLNKIRTILNVAALHGHTTLILSAFGCGAFHNPPSEMALLFKQELESSTYKGRFKKVIFAIKADHNDSQNENFNSFKKGFES